MTDLATQVRALLAESPPTPEQVALEKMEAMNLALTEVAQQITTEMSQLGQALAQVIDRVWTQMMHRDLGETAEKVRMLEAWLQELNRKTTRVVSRRKIVQSRMDWMETLSPKLARNLARTPTEWAKILALNMATGETTLNPDLWKARGTMVTSQKNEMDSLMRVTFQEPVDQKTGMGKVTTILVNLLGNQKVLEGLELTTQAVTILKDLEAPTKGLFQRSPMLTDFRPTTILTPEQAAELAKAHLKELTMTYSLPKVTSWADPASNPLKDVTDWIGKMMDSTPGTTRSTISPTKKPRLT